MALAPFWDNGKKNYFNKFFNSGFLAFVANKIDADLFYKYSRLWRPRCHPLQSTLSDQLYLSDRRYISDRPYLSICLSGNLSVIVIYIITSFFPFRIHTSRILSIQNVFFLGFCPGFGGSPAFTSGPSTRSIFAIICNNVDQLRVFCLVDFLTPSKNNAMPPSCPFRLGRLPHVQQQQGHAAFTSFSDWLTSSHPARTG